MVCLSLILPYLLSIIDDFYAHRKIGLANARNIIVLKFYRVVFSILYFNKYLC